MRASECVREADVLDALQTSAWPECCGAELRAHVDECASCSELVAIVLPLLDEHRSATLEAAVPSAAVVWWRAQLRARQEAERRVARPIGIAQGVSLACGAGVGAAAIGLVSPTFRQLVAWLADLARRGAASAASAQPVSIDGPQMEVLGVLGVTAILAFTALLVLTPLAIYLSAPDD